MANPLSKRAQRYISVTSIRFYGLRLEKRFISCYITKFEGQCKSADLFWYDKKKAEYFYSASSSLLSRLTQMSKYSFVLYGGERPLPGLEVQGFEFRFQLCIQFYPSV